MNRTGRRFLIAVAITCFVGLGGWWFRISSPPRGVEAEEHLAWLSSAAGISRQSLGDIVRVVDAAEIDLNPSWVLFELENVDAPVLLEAAALHGNDFGVDEPIGQNLLLFRCRRALHNEYLSLANLEAQLSWGGPEGNGVSVILLKEEAVASMCVTYGDLQGD